MAEWNRNTFGKDNGVPAGIVVVKDTMSPADFERIKREWRQSYGGPQRRTAFLRGSDIQWQNIGLSHSELDFLQGREAHRNEILNIYGIPVGLVSENATEANAQVAERMFVERTLWPKLVRVAQKITQELLPFWPGEHLAEFEDIRPTDAQARLEEIRVSYPVLSVNEIRERYYQLPSVEWGTLPVGAEKTHAEQQRNRDTEQELNVGAHRDAPAQPAESAAKAVIDELGRWERFATKRHGRANGRPFEVENIPDEIAFEVSAGLLAAESAEDVRQVFKSARVTVNAESAT
jgi:phage portal protein BeeE